MARSLSDRFNRRVDRSGDHHVWLGAVNTDRGTGRLKVDGKNTTAHRVAWTLAHGTVPEGAQVLPCPDVPSCVRVEHLSIAGADAPPTQGPRAPKGTGSKREVRPDVWQLTVNAGRDANGEALRVFRTVSGTRAEAARALAAFVAEVGDGRDLPSRADRGRTLGDLIAEYLHHLEHHKGRKHSTLVRYRGLADTWILPTLGHQRADRLVPRDFESALGAMRTRALSQSSIHQTFILLNGTYKWARRNRYLTHNPMTDTEEPRSTAVPHEVMPPDVEDLRRLLETAFAQEPDFGILCHLGAVTGMRRGELAGLRWDRVDLATGRIRVEVTVNDAGGQVVIDSFTKTRKTRAVNIDARTTALLVAQRDAMAERAALAGAEIAPDGFVFSHSPTCSTPIRPEYLTRRMRQLRKHLGLDAADIDTTLQALRHWTQTTLTEAGYDSRQVAARGGHSEQVMRSVYVHRTTSAEENMSAHLGSLLTDT